MVTITLTFEVFNWNFTDKSAECYLASVTDNVGYDLSGISTKGRPNPLLIFLILAESA